MTPPIIVHRNQHCWGSLNEDFAPPQQHPHGNGYSKYAGRSRAIFGHVSFARVKGPGGWQETTGHRSPIQSAAFRLSRSVIPAKLLPSGRCTAGSLLPSWRGSRLFQFFPALKVAGDLLSIGFHRALTVCQDTARQLANAFHFFNLSKQTVAHCNGRTVERKERSCPTRDGSRMTRNGAKVS